MEHGEIASIEEPASIDIKVVQEMLVKPEQTFHLTCYYMLITLKMQRKKASEKVYIWK